MHSFCVCCYEPFVLFSFVRTFAFEIPCFPPDVCWSRLAILLVVSNTFPLPLHDFLPCSVVECVDWYTVPAPSLPICSDFVLLFGVSFPPPSKTAAKENALLSLPRNSVLLVFWMLRRVECCGVLLLMRLVRLALPLCRVCGRLFAPQNVSSQLEDPPDFDDARLHTVCPARLFRQVRFARCRLFSRAISLRRCRPECNTCIATNGLSIFVCPLLVLYR